MPSVNPRILAESDCSGVYDAVRQQQGCFELAPGGGVMCIHVCIYVCVCVYMSTLTLPWLLKLEFVKVFLLKLTVGLYFGSNTNSAVGTDQLLFASVCDTAALPLVHVSVWAPSPA